MSHVIVSGIQPTGPLHIGNYLGAVKNWLALQADAQNDCFFFVADWHSMTVSYDPKEKQAQVMGLARELLATGLDPARVHLFVQSQVPEHTELAWVLMTLTPMTELQKMTQFKDKSARHADNINTGLFTYPVLQAADILMYKALGVPVGEDQVQHVETTRVIAKKFNRTFGELFPEPKALLTPTARLMSLADSSKKMSKSQGEKSYIKLTDSPEAIKEKIRGAVTDEQGVKNLIELVEYFDSNNTLAAEFSSALAAGTLKNVELKDTLAELISNTFAPFRAAYAKISDREVTAALERGVAHAQEIARATMAEVRVKTGLR